MLVPVMRMAQLALGVLMALAVALVGLVLRTQQALLVQALG